MPSRSDILQGLKKRLELDKANDLDTVIYKCYQASVNDELEEAIKADEKYQKVNMKAYRKTKKINKSTFSSEQWEIIDDVLCANNYRCSEYGRVSYYQGFKDAISYLKEVCQYT